MSGLNFPLSCNDREYQPLEIRSREFSAYFGEDVWMLRVSYLGGPTRLCKDLVPFYIHQILSEL